MPKTYEPIATYTFPSTIATYTFSSIPGTYTDLVLVFDGNSSASTTVGLQMNGAGVGYSATNIYSTFAGATGSTRGTTAAITYINTEPALNSTAASRGVIIFNIMNYANTLTNKTVLARANRSNAGAGAMVGQYHSTSAITSITLQCNAGFTATTKLSLYGIKAA